MKTPLLRLTPSKSVLMVFLLAFTAASCNSDTTAPEDDTVMLLDTTLAFSQGVTCDTGGVNTAFTAAAGTTVTILAQAATNLNPAFVLYAPDFSTQLGASAASGAGRARLVIQLTQAGQHHVTLCEVSGAAGSVRVTVSRPS